MPLTRLSRYLGVPVLATAILLVFSLIVKGLRIPPSAIHDPLRRSGKVSFAKRSVSEKNYLSTSLSSQYGEPSTGQVLPIEYGVLQLPYVPSKPGAASTIHASKLTNTTPSPNACRSSTSRTRLNCPCKMINQRCAPEFSICTLTVTGDGICLCNDDNIAFNNTCVTTDFYDRTWDFFAIFWSIEFTQLFDKTALKGRFTSGNEINLTIFLFFLQKTSIPRSYYYLQW